MTRLLLLTLLLIGKTTFTQSECADSFLDDYNKGKYSTALEKGRNCSEVANNEEYKYFYTRCLMYEKRYREAIRNYKELVTVNPSKVEYLNGVGAAYFFRENYDSALVYYNKGIDINPKFEFGYLNRATLYYMQDEPQKGLDDITIHLENFPNDANAWALKGDCLVELSEYQKAKEAYDNALKIDPKCANAYEGKSDLFISTDNYDLAMENIEEALKINPKEAKYHYIKGEIYYFRFDEDYKKAIKCYEKSLKLEESDIAYYMIGACYEAEDEYEEAANYYEKAIAFSDDDPDYFSDLSFCYYKLGLYEKALEPIRNAIALDPNDSYSHYLHGLIHAELGHNLTALTHFDRAIHLDSTDMDYYFDRGLANQLCKKYDAALQDYNTVLTFERPYSVTYYNMATVYFKLKDYHSAIKQIDIYIGRSPDDPDGYKFRASCNEQFKEYGKVCRDLKIAAELGDEAAKKYIRINCSR